LRSEKLTTALFTTLAVLATRKHLSLTDVAEAGGWRDLRTMLTPNALHFTTQNLDPTKRLSN
jgi:hypothetical protein